jgi:hypothetical protein
MSLARRQTTTDEKVGAARASADARAAIGRLIEPTDRRWGQRLPLSIFMRR